MPLHLEHLKDLCAERRDGELLERILQPLFDLPEDARRGLIDALEMARAKAILRPTGISMALQSSRILEDVLRLAHSVGTVRR